MQGILQNKIKSCMKLLTGRRSLPVYETHGSKKYPSFF